MKTKKILITFALFLFAYFNCVHSQTKDDISLFQEVLTKLGYDSGSIDGLWGRKTEKAVREFQKDHRLQLTGKLDTITKDKMLEVASRMDETEAMMQKLALDVENCILLVTLWINLDQHAELMSYSERGRVAKRQMQEILEEYNIHHIESNRVFSPPKGIFIIILNGLFCFPNFPAEWFNLFDFAFNSNDGSFPIIEFRKGGYEVKYKPEGFVVNLKEDTEIKVNNEIWIYQNDKLKMK